MKNHRRDSVILAISFFLWCPFLAAAETGGEANIIKAMQTVEKNWRTVIDKQQPFLMECANNTWCLVRIVRGGVVSMDLVRTNSVIAPFRGVIQIKAALESNGRSSRANGFYNDYAKIPHQACFATPEQARVATETGDWGPYNDRPANEMTAFYDVTDGKIQLVGGNDMFMNAVGTRIAFPQNAADWSKLLTQLVR